VLTGLLDDHRVPVAPGHRLYRAARWALERQDYWSDEQHAVFWGPALVWWPHAECPRLADQVATAGRAMAGHDAPPQLIADTFGLVPDNPRNHADPDRSPSALLGAPAERAIDHSQEPGVRFRPLPGTYRNGQRPLPRVYEEGQPEPASTYFNPEIALPPSGYGLSPTGERDAERAA